MTVCPRRGATSAANSWLPRSCTSHQPASKAALRSSAGLPLTRNAPCHRGRARLMPSSRQRSTTARLGPARPRVGRARRSRSAAAKRLASRGAVVGHRGVGASRQAEAHRERSAELEAPFAARAARAKASRRDSRSGCCPCARCACEPAVAQHAEHRPRSAAVAAPEQSGAGERTRAAPHRPRPEAQHAGQGVHSASSVGQCRGRVAPGRFAVRRAPRRAPASPFAAPQQARSPGRNRPAVFACRRGAADPRRTSAGPADTGGARPEHARGERRLVVVGCTLAPPPARRSAAVDPVPI